MIPGIDIQQVAPFTVELRFEANIDPKTHSMVIACARDLEAARLPGIATVFITYHSVGVSLDAHSAIDILASLRNWLDSWTPTLSHHLGREHRIPVRFGGPEGPDLPELAAFAQIPESDLIRMFCEHEYRVYMTGFIGGFPYLGTVPEPLRIPRKAQPRKQVAAGSVGIASFQAGIYPVESPGGWTLIGRTDIDIPSLHLQPGDSVRFHEVSDD